MSTDILGLKAEYEETYVDPQTPWGVVYWHFYVLTSPDVEEQLRPTIDRRAKEVKLLNHTLDDAKAELRRQLSEMPNAKTAQILLAVTHGRVWGGYRCSCDETSPPPGRSRRILTIFGDYDYRELWRYVASEHHGKSASDVLDEIPVKAPPCELVQSEWYSEWENDWRRQFSA